MLTRSEQRGHGMKTLWCSSTPQHATIADLSRSSKDSVICVGLVAILTSTMSTMKITNAGYAPNVSTRGTYFSACLYPPITGEESFRHTVELDREGIDHWLDLLEEKYSVRTAVSRSRSGMIGGFYEASGEVIAWTTFHLLGKMRFHTPLMKLLQPLRRQLWDSVLCHAEADGYVIVNSCDVHKLDDARRRRMKQKVIWIGMRMRTMSIRHTRNYQP
jgi:hypothetical protein